MNSNLEALHLLSMEIGEGRYSLDECRQRVRDNAWLIEDVLSGIFTSSLSDARRAFAVLDSCKALLTRRISFQRRAAAVGFSKVDMIVGLTATAEDVDKYLRQNPGVNVCSMYFGSDGEVWCVFAWSSSRRSRWWLSSKRKPAVHYAAIQVIDSEVSKNFLNTLRDYIKSLSSRLPDLELQEELLKALGALIIPAIMRLGLRGGLIIVPHRQLHLLPLHAMWAEFDGKKIFLDSILESVSYSSSLFEMYSPRVVAGREGFRKTIPKLLAVIDSSALELSWLHLEESYFEGLRRIGLPIDIVTKECDLPVDLSQYIWVSWGGHAKSDPINWGGSFLSLGETRHSAKKIALEWSCSYRPWILLAACESGVDSAEIAQVDEYCGLDLAFYVAGAWGAFSTLWPVKDEMAALADILLTHFIVLGRMEPPKALSTLGRRLREGNWKIRVDEGLPREMRDSLNGIQELPDDAFSSIGDWGVFRSYGISYG